MKYRLVIFDFDGTLADSSAWFLRILNVLADEFGFNRLAEADHERVRTWNNRKILQHLAVPLWKLPRIASRMRLLAARDKDEIPLFAGIPEMLEGLNAAGAKVALVSSNAEETIRLILGPECVARIDHFSCGASLFGKASKLKAVVRRFGMRSPEAIYVGDETRDCEAAREAGIAFGAVAWGYANVETLAEMEPEIVFRTVEEIVECVEVNPGVGVHLEKGI